jgi:hypothetical protein
MRHYYAVTKPMEKYEATINLTSSPVEYFLQTSEVFADTVWPCQNLGFGHSFKGKITYGPIKIQVKLSIL